MSSAAVRTRYTPEQYLALERKAAFKSEYDNGFISAMSGASLAHNRIAVNLTGAISPRLKDGPCERFVGDLRVCISSVGLYAYPNLVAVCGEPHFLDSELDTLLNPTLIIEILSPSTETYDRGRKFAHYRRAPSLREYVLVSQDKPLVERYTRQGEEWVLNDLTGLDDVLRLTSVGCEVPLREVYARVSFPESDEPTTGLLGPPRN